MSLQTRLNALITIIKTETKALRTLISGTNNGNVSALTTTATNLVGAVNEVKVTADAAGTSDLVLNDSVTNTSDVWSGSKINTELAAAAAAGSSDLVLNDAVTNSADVWSGTKIDTELAATQAAAVAQAKNEILDGAAAEVDTLVEIAAALASNTGTDAALAATVANKANTSAIHTQAELGNYDTDLAALWTAA